MARFYKTARPQFIDYAFQAPTGLLARVIEKKDRDVDMTFSELEKAELALARQKDTNAKIGQGMYVAGDAEANEKLMQAHKQKIDDLTKQLSDNPSAYGKIKGDIAQLRTDIRKDFLYGLVLSLPNTKTRFKMVYLDGRKF